MLVVIHVHRNGDRGPFRNLLHLLVGSGVNFDHIVSFVDESDPVHTLPLHVIRPVRVRTRVRGQPAAPRHKNGGNGKDDAEDSGAHAVVQGTGVFHSGAILPYL